MISPTIGRVVLVHGLRLGQVQAMPALVAYVWNDRLINVGGFDNNGAPFAQTSRRLWPRPLRKGADMAHHELKLEIRDIGPMIIARLSDDEVPGGVPIATLNVSIANAHPEAFEKFKAFATDIVRLMLEEAGAEVHGFMGQPVDCGEPGHA